DLHAVAHVETALAAGAASAAPPAHAEEVVEDIREGRGEIGAEAGAAGAPTMLEGGVAEAVIGGALVAVLEHLVGLVDLLEAMLAVLVARIAVRVMLHRGLAERGLDFRIARRPLNAERLVVVALGHLAPSSPEHAGPGAAQRRARVICHDSAPA